jgi:hypothetical protein
VKKADPQLETARDRGQFDPAELGAITAWRRLNATSAFLLGALKIHGRSTAKVDIHAEFEDPFDDLTQLHS